MTSGREGVYVRLQSKVPHRVHGTIVMAFGFRYGQRRQTRPVKRFIYCVMPDSLISETLDASGSEDVFVAVGDGSVMDGQCPPMLGEVTISKTTQERRMQ